MEFPISQAGSAGSATSANPAQPKVANFPSARTEHARNWHNPSYHPEATNANPNMSKTSPAGAGATVSAADPPKYSVRGTRSSNTKSSASTSSETRWSPPASPDDRSCGGSRSPGQEVLCTMGGGYLTVTVLCTLSRALPSATPTPNAHRNRRWSHHSHQRENAAFGQFRPTQEVSALLSLLASLFRLGSPFSQVRALSIMFGCRPPPPCDRL